MTKQFTLLQLFCIVDGRLATKMDDVYITLNHIMDDNLFTHHLPVAMDYLKQENPQWFQDLSKKIKGIIEQCPVKRKSDQSKETFEMEEFDWIINEVKQDSTQYEIPQLVSTEEERKKFVDYMMDNSLLKGKKVIVVNK